LNIPLIKLFETQGAVLATALGYMAAILINLYVIKTYAKYPFKLVLRRGMLIVLFTACMYIAAGVVYKITTAFLSPAANLQAAIIVVICAAAGAGVYFYLSFRTKLIYLLFGSRV